MSLGLKEMSCKKPAVISACWELGTLFWTPESRMEVGFHPPLQTFLSWFFVNNEPLLINLPTCLREWQMWICA